MYVLTESCTLYSVTHKLYLFIYNNKYHKLVNLNVRAELKKIDLRPTSPPRRGVSNGGLFRGSDSLTSEVAADWLLYPLATHRKRFLMYNSIIYNPLKLD